MAVRVTLAAATPLKAYSADQRETRHGDTAASGASLKATPSTKPTSPSPTSRRQTIRARRPPETPWLRQIHLIRILPNPPQSDAQRAYHTSPTSQPTTSPHPPGSYPPSSPTPSPPLILLDSPPPSEMASLPITTKPIDTTDIPELEQSGTNFMNWSMCVRFNLGATRVLHLLTAPSLPTTNTSKR